MTFLLKRGTRYYYNRRVPDIFRHLDRRDTVRVSLRTDSRAHAWRKAVALNDEVEAYWQSLINETLLHDASRFGKIVLVAHQLGFSYQPMSAVATLPLQQLVERVLATRDASPKQVEALLGGKEAPLLPLSKVLDKYWELAKDKIAGKSLDQVRKWRRPRARVIDRFIRLTGDKELKDVTRDDVLSFRDWWLERIRTEDQNALSANKEFIHLKGILELVSEHYKVGLDVPHLFKKVKLATRFKKQRLPFTTEQIITMLHSDKLYDMNKELRWFLLSAAETGARPSELTGLMPEDIRLNAPVPHITITDRKERTLKNAHSERVIPLVGYALAAFRACPQGFPRYRDKTDNLSNAANKFLRQNGLLPSAQHSVYSFRHSFQDRILGINAPDRVQAELMGHRFNRPKYGNGPSLEQKKEWMDRVCLMQPNQVS
ncbi:MAG: integrase [Flavobacteriales bacterium]|jgi:integrase|nr:integrase [Flavobacteriales bacterium]